GLGRDGPREQAPAGDRRRPAHPGPGPTRGPPRRAGLSPRLRPALSHRWLARVYDRLADPLWALGAARAQADTRPYPQAALAAAAPVPLTRVLDKPTQPRAVPVPHATGPVRASSAETCRRSARLPGSP